MMKQRKRRPTVRPRKIFQKCPFCEKKTTPDYKKTEGLEPFLTSRDRILPRSASGLCRKHQSALKREIKRARFLALLPFSPMVK